MKYKLIGAKENETPEETVVRCANNLIKAVLAAGYSLHSTPGLSGVEVKFYDHIPNRIFVENCLGHWALEGVCPVKISFAPEPDTLTLDE